MSCRNVVAGWGAFWALMLVASGTFGQGSVAKLKPGDQVELKGGKYRGSVVAVDGDKVSVLVSVPVGEAAKAGSSNPGLSNPGLSNSTASPKSKYAGTWQTTDRALVIYDDKVFRIQWHDGRTIRVDDGTYTRSGDGNKFYFTSEGETWPWTLHSFDGDTMTMSHVDVGQRTFRRVSATEGNPLVGTWSVNWVTNRGRSGTAKLYLYPEGLYVIDEYDQYGRFDHGGRGTWSGDGDSLDITLYHEGRYRTVRGKIDRIDRIDRDHMSWTFTNLVNERYTYRSERSGKLIKAVAASSTPSTSIPAAPSNPPPRPRRSKYAGTWQGSDRTLVIYDEKKFRILWMDGDRVRVDDGTYTLSSDGRTFNFRSKKGETWPWRLHSFDGDTLTMSHADVGTRTCRLVRSNKGSPLVGSWNVDWTTNRGRSGSAKLYLYSEGMYIIYEDDHRNDRNDHNEQGTWTANINARTMSITVYYNRRYSTVTGSLNQTDRDHFVWTFSNLANENYTYRCRRKPSP